MSTSTATGGNPETQERTDIGVAIRNVRKRRALTQAELAAKLFHSQQWISDLENGDIDPTVAQVREIAVVLEVDICQLIKSPN